MSTQTNPSYGNSLMSAGMGAGFSSDAFAAQAMPHNPAAARETHTFAALVCLIGVFLHIVLSEPLLNAMGIDYSDEAGTGNPFGKIHPGSYFIFLALVVLLFDSGAPMSQMVRTFRDYTTYSLLFLLYIVLCVYWVCRDPAGVGLLIDTHMPVAICAVVLSYAPRSFSRKAIHVFVLLAVINSLTGVAESIGRFRVFTFDPHWVILHEEDFRATAFLGHPLNNAMFTSVAFFVAMGMDYKVWLKAFLMAAFLAGLVAFGGRAAFVYSLVALVPLGFVAVRKALADLTMIKMFLVIAAVILVPILVAGGVYLLLTSSIGDRLMDFSSLNDSSAHVRTLSFDVYHFMTTNDILWGVSVDKAKEVTLRMGLVIPADDIENPWVLMTMYLGMVMFSVWFVMTAAFAVRLMMGKPLALQLAVLAYYVSASTSNSFGRKDSIYTIMVASVICAANALAPPQPRPERRRQNLEPIIDMRREVAF